MKIAQNGTLPTLYLKGTCPDCGCVFFFHRSRESHHEKAEPQGYYVINNCPYCYRRIALQDDQVTEPTQEEIKEYELQIEKSERVQR